MGHPISFEFKNVQKKKEDDCQNILSIKDPNNIVQNLEDTGFRIFCSMMKNPREHVGQKGFRIWDPIIKGSIEDFRI